jgi:hypothetical protein
MAKKAADGKAIRARRAAAALVAVLALGAGALSSAPAGTAADVDGDTPAIVGAGGEHYGDGWNNYGHALEQPRTVR